MNYTRHRTYTRHAAPAPAQDRHGTGHRTGMAQDGTGTHRHRTGMAQDGTGTGHRHTGTHRCHWAPKTGHGWARENWPLRRDCLESFKHHRCWRNSAWQIDFQWLRLTQLNNYIGQATRIARLPVSWAFIGRRSTGTSGSSNGSRTFKTGQTHPPGRRPLARGRHLVLRVAAIPTGSRFSPSSSWGSRRPGFTS